MFLPDDAFEWPYSRRSEVGKRMCAYPFEKAGEAYARMMSGKRKFRVVLICDALLSLRSERRPPA